MAAALHGLPPVACQTSVSAEPSSTYLTTMNWPCVPDSFRCV